MDSAVKAFDTFNTTLDSAFDTLLRELNLQQTDFSSIYGPQIQEIECLRESSKDFTQLLRKENQRLTDLFKQFHSRNSMTYILAASDEQNVPRADVTLPSPRSSRPSVSSESEMSNALLFSASSDNGATHRAIPDEVIMGGHPDLDLHLLMPFQPFIDSSCNSCYGDSEVNGPSLPPSVPNQRRIEVAPLFLKQCDKRPVLAVVDDRQDDMRAPLPPQKQQHSVNAQSREDGSLIRSAAFIENLNQTPIDAQTVEFKNDTISRQMRWTQPQPQKRDKREKRDVAAASDEEDVPEQPRPCPPNLTTDTSLIADDDNGNGRARQSRPPSDDDYDGDSDEIDEQVSVGMPESDDGESADDGAFVAWDLRFSQTRGPFELDSQPPSELFSLGPSVTEAHENEETAVDGEESPEHQQQEPPNEAVDTVSFFGPSVHVPELGVMRHDLNFYFQRNHDDLIKVMLVLRDLRWHFQQTNNVDAVPSAP